MSDSAASLKKRHCVQPGIGHLTKSQAMLILNNCSKQMLKMPSSATGKKIRSDIAV